MSQGFSVFPIFRFEIRGNNNSHHKEETVSSSTTEVGNQRPAGFECGARQNFVQCNTPGRVENIKLFKKLLHIQLHAISVA